MKRTFGFVSTPIDAEQKAVKPTKSVASRTSVLTWRIPSVGVLSNPHPGEAAEKAAGRGDTLVRCEHGDPGANTDGYLIS
jgi:hypothetical protein